MYESKWLAHGLSNPRATKVSQLARTDFAFRVGVDDVPVDCGQPYTMLATSASTRREKRNEANSAVWNELTGAAGVACGFSSNKWFYRFQDARI